MSLLRFLTLLICVVVVAGSPQPSAAGIFVTPRTYPSGAGVVAAAVQDFNNDGFADIVTANLTDKNVSVFINNGDGSFGAASNLSIGAGAVEVASGDLDGDGNADLVVTDANTSVHVALGHGDGTFGAFSTITLHSQPKGIAIADLNSDGIPDLAIAIFGPAQTFDGEVAVLIGNGDGSFAPPVYYELGENANGVVATDLNSDGKLDLAVAIQHGSHPTNGLAVLLGNGDGTFQSPVISVAGVGGTDVAAADFNGDGKMDLALATNSPVGEVEVVLGNGDGTFQPPTAYSTGGVDFTNTISVADVNRDGFADLVVGGSNTAVLLGDGTGSFGPAAVYWIDQSSQGFARVGYLNRDRIPDIVGNGGPSEITVAFGRADGVFNAPRVYPPFGVGALASADFDGDGQADIVTYANGQLFFLHGVGDGTFAAAVAFANLATQVLFAADFNSDGKEDLLALTFHEDIFYTILGNGDGTFQSPLATTVPDLGGDGFEAAVSDFNHDGKPDVALTSFFSDSLFILLGNGDGTFQTPIIYHTAPGPGAPQVADLNLDGNVDLVVSADTINIYLGVGDGTFQAPLVTSVCGFPQVGDFNGDGVPDLVVVCSDTEVLLGNGDGTFQTPQTVFAGNGSVTVGDIDLDGRLDLMISSETTLVALRGQGDGTFRPPVDILTGAFGSVGPVILKDLNGDGAPDAVMNGGPFSVLINASRRHR